MQLTFLSYTVGYFWLVQRVKFLAYFVLSAHHKSAPSSSNHMFPGYQVILRRYVSNGASRTDDDD